MRVACLQMCSGLSVDDNLLTLQNMIGEATGRGARYIQTPEMSSLIEKNKTNLFKKIEPDDGTIGANKVINALSDLAKTNKIWLHAGSIAIKSPSGKALNRGLLFSPDGKRIASYDKIHMFDVDLPQGESWRESATYDAGNEAIVVETEEFSLGLSICYDLRFPHLYRALAKSGAAILTCPAAFTQQTGEKHWHLMLRSRAIENGAFMIAAAQGGTHQDGRETFGHSLVIDPQGEIIAELEHDRPDILTCDIDLGLVAIARTQIQSLKHDTPFKTVVIEQDK